MIHQVETSLLFRLRLILLLELTQLYLFGRFLVPLVYSIFNFCCIFPDCHSSCVQIFLKALILQIIRFAYLVWNVEDMINLLPFSLSSVSSPLRGLVSCWAYYVYLFYVIFTLANDLSKKKLFEKLLTLITFRQIYQYTFRIEQYI